MNEEQLRLEIKKLVAERQRLLQNIRCQKYRAKMLKVSGFKEKEKIRHHNDYVKNKPMILIKTRLWQKANPKKVNAIRRNHYWNHKLGVRWKP